MAIALQKRRPVRTFVHAMDIQTQINQLINVQPEPKGKDLQELHQRILAISPDCRLWFDEGKNEEGKTIANPTIGYGFQILRYAGGQTKEFFRIGVSANATGISVYILGLDDKTFLQKTYGDRIGKAKVTGYCIRFKSLSDIQIEVLLEAIRYGLEYAPASKT